jgi:Flp pilus assembly protein TadB
MDLFATTTTLSGATSMPCAETLVQNKKTRETKKTSGASGGKNRKTAAAAARRVGAGRRTGAAKKLREREKKRIVPQKDKGAAVRFRAKNILSFCLKIFGSSLFSVGASAAAALKGRDVNNRR